MWWIWSSTAVAFGHSLYIPHAICDFLVQDFHTLSFYYMYMDSHLRGTSCLVMYVSDGLSSRPRSRSQCGCFSGPVIVAWRLRMGGLDLDLDELPVRLDNDWSCLLGLPFPGLLFALHDCLPDRRAVRLFSRSIQRASTCTISPPLDSTCCKLRPALPPRRLLE